MKWQFICHETSRCKFQAYSWSDSCQNNFVALCIFDAIQDSSKYRFADDGASSGLFEDFFLIRYVCYLNLNVDFILSVILVPYRIGRNLSISYLKYRNSMVLFVRDTMKYDSCSRCVHSEYFIKNKCVNNWSYLFLSIVYTYVYISLVYTWLLI